MILKNAIAGSQVNRKPQIVNYHSATEANQTL